jgi:cobalamin transport system permease protein
MSLTKTTWKRWVILPVILLVLMVADISYGSVSIPIPEILAALVGKQTSDPIWGDIIWNFRLTKALTCILAGGALAAGGLQMQTLFRNPLAGPDVLGLSSGASLMVSLLILGGGKAALLSGPWSIAIAASIGCGGVFLIVLVFARRLRDPASLLIVGLMIGAGTSSIVSVLQFASKADQLQNFLIWTFGNVSSMNWSEITVLFWIFGAGTIIALICAKSLNAWILGDNYAQSLGVDLRRSRMWIIISASLLTGGVTAFCGPIAFVGLAVPHLTKLLIKTANHRVLIPHVIMAGAILVLLCDILAQLPGGAKVLPLNAITALFGAPVVIWVVVRSKIIRV